MNTKTRKKVTNKRMPKKTNKKTFYGMASLSELKGNIDNDNDWGIFVDSCKSDHMNHTVNSFLKHNKEENINKYAILRIEVLGKPQVKTTREITIKK